MHAHHKQTVRTPMMPTAEAAVGVETPMWRDDEYSPARLATSSSWLQASDSRRRLLGSSSSPCRPPLLLLVALQELAPADPAPVPAAAGSCRTAGPCAPWALTAPVSCEMRLWRRLSSDRRVRPVRLGSCVSWLAAALRLVRLGRVLMGPRLLSRLLWRSSCSSLVSACRGGSRQDVGITQQAVLTGD